MGKKQFCFFQTAETGNRTPDSGVKGSGANHYPRAPALQDTIDSIDDVPQRVAVDNTVNQYGHHLLDFLKDTKLCMLNGRISPCLANFTWLAVEGNQ